MTAKKTNTPRTIFKLVVALVSLAAALSISYLLTLTGFIEPQMGPTMSLLITAIGVFANIGTIFTVIRESIDGLNGKTAPEPTEPFDEKTYRQKALRIAEDDWIKGSLDQFSKRSGSISITLKSAPHLIDARRMRALVATSEFEITSGEIAEHFDSPLGSLLLAGEAGSGKTMTLLSLERTLLARASRDPDHPVPVVLSLSSWVEKQPMYDWLEQQLMEEYELPASVCRRWIRGKLLLLLDGLDEGVGPEGQAFRVDAINELRKLYGVGLVVCSRLEPLGGLPELLKLERAFILQPLSKALVSDHLASYGSHYHYLSMLLRNNNDLAELAKTPLMLGIMMVVYSDGANVLRTKSESEATVDYLFDQYMERVLERASEPRLYVPETQKGNTPYSPKEVRHWLGWLARQLVLCKRPDFHLEDMQPNWLSSGLHRSIVIDGLMWLTWLCIGLLVGSKYGFWFGAAAGGVIGILFRGETIQTVETIRFVGIRFDVKKAILAGKSMVFPVVLLLLIGKLWGVIDDWIGVMQGIALGLFVYVPFHGLLGGVDFGVRRGVLVDKATANEGVRLSLLNGLLAILPFALGTIACGVWAGMISGNNADLVWPILYLGLLMGAGVGLPSGLRAALQHGILRLLLWREGFTTSPWQYTRFLDFCVDRGFLTKRGGHYEFSHELLKEWLAKPYSHILQDREDSRAALADAALEAVLARYRDGKSDQT